MRIKYSSLNSSGKICIKRYFSGKLWNKEAENCQITLNKHIKRWYIHSLNLNIVGYRKKMH